MRKERNKCTLTLKKQAFSADAISKFKSFQKINLPARSSLLFAAINLISKGSALIFTPIFTRILTPASYGEYTLFTSYLSLMLALGSLELSSGVIIRAFQKYKDKSYITILSASVLTSVLTVIIAVILYILRVITKNGMSFSFSYVFLFLNAASVNIINIYLSKSRFEYRWLPSLLTAIIGSIAAPLISILAIKSALLESRDNVSIKVGTSTLFLLLCALFIIYFSVKSAKKEKNSNKLKLKKTILFAREVLAFMLKLALPLLPYYFSVSLISHADKILISRFLGNSELGKYSVAYSAGIAPAAFTSGLCSSLCPWIMRKVRSGDLNKIKSVLNSFISICTLAIICFLCFAPDIFSLLAPEEYSSALPIIFITSLIPICIAVSQCMSSIAIAKEKVKGVTLCGILPALFSFVFGFLFIPGESILIPAFITTCSYILLSVLSTINIASILRKSPINVIKTLQNALLFSLLSAFLFVFRENILIRISVFIFSFVFILLALKSSVKLIKEYAENTENAKFADAKSETSAV